MKLLSAMDSHVGRRYRERHEREVTCACQKERCGSGAARFFNLFDEAAALLLC